MSENQNVVVYKSDRYEHMKIDHTHEDGVESLSNFAPNGMYATENPAEIEALENNPEFQRSFYRLDEDEPTPQTEDFEGMTREQLRSRASGIESINGNQSNEELKHQLQKHFDDMDEAPSNN